MTSRNDYVPGDVGAIRAVATGIQSIGQEFGDASTELASVQAASQSSGWIGSAADQFDVTIAGLPQDLIQMSGAHDRVADALLAYAATLERLQQATDRAIERLNIKEAERNNADSQSDAARNRIIGLTAQLGVAQGVEKAAWLKYQAAKFDPVPGNEAGPYNSYLNARSKVGTLSQQRGNEQGTKNHWDNIKGDAQNECNSLRSKLNGYKDERRAAEKVCADRIKGALPEHLKNPGNFEKAVNWVSDKASDLGKALAKIGEGVLEGIATGEWDKLIDGIHDLAGTIADICDILSFVVLIGTVILAVGALILGTITTGVGGVPAALAILQGGFMLSNAIGKVGTAARGVSFGTGIYLASTSAVVDGRRAVTWGEVASDGFSFGAGLAANKFIGRGDNLTPHLGLAQRGFVNFGKEAASLGNPLATQIFMNDFNKTVVVPHLRKAITEALVTEGAEQGADTFGNVVLRPGVDDLANQTPNELMLEEEDVRSINVDEIVDEAMEESR